MLGTLVGEESGILAVVRDMKFVHPEVPSTTGVIRRRLRTDTVPPNTLSGKSAPDPQ